MKVVFRADASVAIGMGHVMRCAALAQRLAARGAFIRFVCAKRPGHLGDYLARCGFDVVLISGADALKADLMLAVLSDLAPVDLLVVDHYLLDAFWEKQLRSVVHRILVIDDLGNRDHDCDILLDQNAFEAGEKAYRGRVPNHCKILVGPRNALLREEFENLDLLRVRDGSVQRMLVFFGGSDPTNLTGKALEALGAIEAHINIQVVLGNANKHKPSIATRALTMGNVFLHENTTKMAQLISACDLAIGACGTHSWERCALGLPALVLITAENQRRAARLLHSKGAVECLGDEEQIAIKTLTAIIQQTITTPDKVAAMAKNATGVTFGWQAAMQALLSNLSGNTDLWRHTVKAPFGKAAS